MKKSGIAISTYFGPNSHWNRKNIFLASVYSVLASGFDGKIVVVDDGSPTNEHLNGLYDITSRIQYIKLPSGSGIARSKNAGITALGDCEYKFLADDDMLYNGDWWKLYVDACEKTGIQHFSYYIPQLHHSPKAEIVTRNDVRLIRHRELNGCLLFITNSVVNKIGMFVETERKTWLEHPTFSRRCEINDLCPFFCDVYESRSYIRLNRSSYFCKAAMVRRTKTRRPTK
ncbi:MAG: glycosyltransferase [bacterium]